MTDKILVICVDYQSENETISYVSDIRSQSISDQIDIIVVCNSGTQKLDRALSNFSDIYLYDFHQNMGYFPAADAGLQEYLKVNEMPKLVIVSNTDIRIKQDRFFDKLLNAPYCFDVLGPSIINLIGQDQNPFIRKRLTISKLKFLLNVFRFYPLYYLYSYLSNIKIKIKSGFQKTDVGDNDLRHESIYAPHGSFIVFAQSYFSKGGDLSHDSFLYGEELYVAETAIKYSMNVVFEKSLCIEHLEHVTTGLIGSRKKAKYLYDATKHILIKFYDGK